MAERVTTGTAESHASWDPTRYPVHRRRSYLRKTREVDQMQLTRNLRYWPSIEPSLDQYLVFAGFYCPHQLPTKYQGGGGGGVGIE